MLGELKSVMAERGIKTVWTEGVIPCLVRKGYSAAYGARNLRRLIQKEIEDPAAEKMIAFTAEHGGAAASSIVISAQDDSFTIEIR